MDKSELVGRGIGEMTKSICCQYCSLHLGTQMSRVLGRRIPCIMLICRTFLTIAEERLLSAELQERNGLDSDGDPTFLSFSHDLPLRFECKALMHNTFFIRSSATYHSNTEMVPKCYIRS